MSLGVEVGKVYSGESWTHERVRVKSQAQVGSYPGMDSAHTRSNLYVPRILYIRLLVLTRNAHSLKYPQGYLVLYSIRRGSSAIDYLAPAVPKSTRRLIRLGAGIAKNDGK